jgi:uncharacterized protein with PQ loop repeat
MATAEQVDGTTAAGAADEGRPARRLVDRLTLVAAVVEPLLLYPQAVGILVHRDARAVFLPTWCGVCLMTALWVWYAVVHRERTVLLYQGLFLLADLLVVLGALRYGGRWS